LVGVVSAALIYYYIMHMGGGPPDSSEQNDNDLNNSKTIIKEVSVEIPRQCNENSNVVYVYEDLEDAVVPKHNEESFIKIEKKDKFILEDI
jgi:hypothetical protein